MEIKKDKEVRLELHKRMRAVYKRSGLNYNQLCTLLGVKRDTLAHWLAKTDFRVPPEYVVTWAEDKVTEYLKNPYELTAKENA